LFWQLAEGVSQLPAECPSGSGTRRRQRVRRSTSVAMAHWLRMSGDLLRAPLQVELGLYFGLELGVRGQLGASGMSGALAATVVGQVGVVPVVVVRAAVAPQLPADRRGARRSRPSISRIPRPRPRNAAILRRSNSDKYRPEREASGR
jgi:hypothetical protein